MEDFIKDVSTRLGVTESVARESIKVLLKFAQDKMGATDFAQLIDRIPGAADLLAEPAVSGGGGGMFGGLGALLGEAGKAMADLKAAGLESGKIPELLALFVDKAREVVGPDTVDAFLKKIPMLQTLLGSKA